MIRVIEKIKFLFDVIFVSYLEWYVICGNLYMGFSDYDFIYVVWKNKLFRVKVCEIEYRSMW